MLVLLFSVLLFYKAIGSDEPGDWVPWPVGILAGASLAHVAFRHLGWGRTAARFLRLVCLVGFVIVLLGVPLLLGFPIFPPPLPAAIPTPSNIFYRAVEGFLLGTGVIAVERYRRLSDEDPLITPVSEKHGTVRGRTFSARWLRCCA